MRLYKRNGGTFWFEMWYHGKRYRRSTKKTSPSAAKDEMSKFRTKLTEGDRPVAPGAIPTLIQFKPTFELWVASKTDNVRSRQYYSINYRILCEYEPLGRAKLSDINEPLIDDLKLWAFRTRSRTTVDRYLAVLRKTLRYACFTKKLIAKVPVVALFKEDRHREFVFDDDTYANWLSIAPYPLREASVLAHQAGLCRGEMLALERDCIELNDVEDPDGFWGRVHIRRGLKRAARRRSLGITRSMALVLADLLRRSQCQYVFTSVKDTSKPLTANTLANQHRNMIATGEFPKDSGLHALRHTFLTECGKRTNDVRALMKLAGHCVVSTTMRYIHPAQKDMDAIQLQVARDRVKRAEDRIPTIPTIETGTKPAQRVN